MLNVVPAACVAGKDFQLLAFVVGLDFYGLWAFDEALFVAWSAVCAELAAVLVRFQKPLSAFELGFYARALPRGDYIYSASPELALEEVAYSLRYLVAFCTVSSAELQVTSSDFPRLSCCLSNFHFAGPYFWRSVLHC